MTTGQALPASLDDDDDVPMGLFNRPIKSNKKIRKRKQPTTNENGGDLTLDSLPSPWNIFEITMPLEILFF